MQAAVAHAQFETIHPYVDGNGRTGRALVHVTLGRRGLAPTFVPPISLVLATHASDYVAGLTLTRHVGDPEGTAARDATNEWLEFFAAACLRAVAVAYEAAVIELHAMWRQRLGRVRRGSATDLVLTALAGSPIITVQSAPAPHRPQHPGDQRGGRPAHRRRHPEPDHGGPAQMGPSRRSSSSTSSRPSSGSSQARKTTRESRHQSAACHIDASAEVVRHSRSQHA